MKKTKMGLLVMLSCLLGLIYAFSFIARRLFSSKDE